MCTAVQPPKSLPFFLSQIFLDSNVDFMGEHIPKSIKLFLAGQFQPWWYLWVCVAICWLWGNPNRLNDHGTSDHRSVFKGNGIWGKCGNWDILMATKMLHSKQCLFCVCLFLNMNIFAQPVSNRLAKLRRCVSLVSFVSSDRSSYSDGGLLQDNVRHLW